jgi:hypothetical protein
MAPSALARLAAPLSIISAWTEGRGRGRHETTEADADQPEAGIVQLLQKKVAPRPVNMVGQVAGLFEPAVSGCAGGTPNP